MSTFSAVGSCSVIERTVTFVGGQAGENHAADRGSVRYLIECDIDTVLSLVAPSRSQRHPSLGDGRREVHCNTCEGAGAALRTYLRSFRGVHKRYLHLYVATYEAIVNAKRVTPALIRRMCVGHVSAHPDYT